MNRLYFGDCLNVLRNEIADESVDLVYLDPPFNSSRDYNLLFRAPTGHESEAQIAAFEDTWHWGEQAEKEYRDLLTQGCTSVSELMNSFRRFLGENDLMAYLTMMSTRLLEMKRILKSKGSLYLHCDPTASHYLKVILDSVFDADCFKNEIIWVRATPRAHAFTRYPSTHDVLLYYSRSADAPIWNTQYSPHREEYIKTHYGNVEPETGRRYMLDNLLNPNRDRPNLTYEFPPCSGNIRVWRWTKERMMDAWEQGRVIVPEKGGMPRYKRYLDEMKGTPITSVWTDIFPVNSQAQERLGYPTQKPLQLLERIIQASSNSADVVLDPFCGCGTAIHAAQKLGRRWIGIDITHLAISLIEKRLRDAFPSIEFEVHGTPKDLDGARDLASRDKYQFQWWACSLVGAQPWQDKKKGADRGIDGIIYFQDEKGIPKKIIVSVKGGESVGRAMIADLKNSVEREKAQIGLFVTLAAPTREMVKEALTAGFYESPNFKSGEYPKIQILTIEGLLKGTQRPRYPDLSQGAYTFKRATQELEVADSGSDLFEKRTDS
jgi:site-specific DNA-methyltransferase (adenine-specific)